MTEPTAREYNTHEKEVTAVSIRTKKWILGIAIAAVTLFIWSMSLQSAAVSFQQSDAIAAPMTEYATAPGKWLSDVPPPGSWISVFSILVRKSPKFGCNAAYREAIDGRKGAYLLRDVRSARLSANNAESRAYRVAIARQTKNYKI